MADSTAREIAERLAATTELLKHGSTDGKPWTTVAEVLPVVRQLSREVKRLTRDLQEARDLYEANHG